MVTVEQLKKELDAHMPKSAYKLRQKHLELLVKMLNIQYARGKKDGQREAA